MARRTAAEDRKVEANRQALSSFRSKAVKKAPTKRHRAALWENMLGTVYAMNPAGEVRYFDYDYEEAVKFIGANITDVRVAKFDRRTSPYGQRSGADYVTPRQKQVVWFVIDDEAAMRYRLETRNDWHEQTREWASRNPFRGGAPWMFNTIDDAKARGAILMSTSATAFRIIDTTTGEPVYRHEAES